MPELSAELVQQAIDGDRAAVRTLVDALTPVIQARVARVLLRRRDRSANRNVRQEIEDLTQQVFLSLFADQGRALGRWDPGRGLSLQNFVGLLAEHEAVSTMRSKRRSPWTEEPVETDDLDRSADSEKSPERIIERRETLVAVLQKVREKLSDRGLDLFQWLIVEGRTVEDVCTATGMSADAVYAWKSRLGKLVRQIAEELTSEKCTVPRKPDLEPSS